VGRRPMAHTLARRDEVLAVLREHGLLSTKEVAEAMGRSIVCGCTMQPRVGDWVCQACGDTGMRGWGGHEVYRLLAPMEKLGLVDGFRVTNRDSVQWTLGPAAPLVELDEAALLGEC
jgi:hypothetical protein